MSGATPNLDIQEQIARIERAQEETRKFTQEGRKLQAEAAKMLRDTMLAPWQIVITAMAAGGALVGGTVALMRLLGS